ncbi:MAG: DoxX family protein [Micromonosporaceae bacterium]
MTTDTTQRPSTTSLRIGQVLTVLVAAFLLFDAVIHIMNIQVVQEATAQLGYPAWTATFIGVLELIGVVLYLIPRTSLLGAIYLSAYLGGAFASQLRIEAPWFSTLLFPVYVGAALWLGLYLRDPEVRRVLPLRRA